MSDIDSIVDEFIGKITQYEISVDNFTEFLSGEKFEDLILEINNKLSCEEHGTNCFSQKFADNRGDTRIKGLAEKYSEKYKAANTVEGLKIMKSLLNDVREIFNSPQSNCKTNIFITKFLLKVEQKLEFNLMLASFAQNFMPGPFAQKSAPTSQPPVPIPKAKSKSRPIYIED